MRSIEGLVRGLLEAIGTLWVLVSSEAPLMSLALATAVILLAAGVVLGFRDRVRRGLACLLIGLIPGGHFWMNRGEIRDSVTLAQDHCVGVEVFPPWDRYPKARTALDTARIIAPACTRAINLLNEGSIWGLQWTSNSTEVLSSLEEELPSMVEQRQLPRRLEEELEVLGSKRLAEASPHGTKKICLYPDKIWWAFGQFRVQEEEAQVTFVSIIIMHELLHISRRCGGLIDRGVRGEELATSSPNPEHACMELFLASKTPAISRFLTQTVSTTAASGACAYHQLDSSKFRDKEYRQAVIKQLKKKPTAQMGHPEWGGALEVQPCPWCGDKSPIFLLQSAELEKS